MIPVKDVHQTSMVYVVVILICRGKFVNSGFKWNLAICPTADAETK